jgi:predicted transcriptional regulator
VLRGRFVAQMGSFRKQAPLARKLLKLIVMEVPMNQLIVSQLMQHPVIEIDPETDVEFALELTRTLGVHYFPLLRGTTLLGMVCACDLDDAPRGTPVLEHASRDVLIVTGDTKLNDAAKAMLSRTVGSAVVMQSGAVCGLLTREDIKRADPELAELFAEQRCSSCGAAKHLRRWGAAELLCASCAGRARADGWLEDGGGD